MLFPLVGTHFCIQGSNYARMKCNLHQSFPIGMEKINCVAQLCCKTIGPNFKIKATLHCKSFFYNYIRNVCFIKIRSKLSSVLLVCLLRFFMKHTLGQRASADELRAAIDVARKQYQPKQQMSCHFHCFL